MGVGRCWPAASDLFVARHDPYNVIEAAVALSEGALVCSTALIGFRTGLGHGGGIRRRPSHGRSSGAIPEARERWPYET